MSESIGPKIEVKGEKEFKSTIAQINTNLKTLGSEMKLVTSQFDSNEKSVASLSAKNDVLVKQIEEQSDKVDVLKEALSKASSEYGESDTRTQKWQQSLNNAQADLNKMVKELENNNDAIDKMSDGMDDGIDATEDMSGNIKDFGDNAEKSGKSALSMGDIIKANLISDAIVSGVKALGSAMVGLAKGAVEGVASLVEDTAEYRKEVSLLEQNASDAGVSFDGMKDKLTDLTALTGDSGASVEALSNLMATGFDDNQITTAVDALSGAVVKFPDTLKIESLSDSLQETIKTGEATGQFSELIGRMGGNVDAFNEQLASCTTEAEKQQVALSWLAQSGLSEVNSAYQEQNSAMLEAEKAQVRYNDAMAELATKAEPMVATMKGDVADVMANFINVINGDKDAVDDFASSIQTFVNDAVNIFNETMPIIADVATKILPVIVDAIVQNLPQIIDCVVTLFDTLMTAITDNLPQLMDCALQILTTIAQAIIDNLPELLECALQIILQLAQGISESLPELIPQIVEVVIQIVETLIDNVDLLIDAAIALIEGLALGISEAIPILIEKAPEIITKLASAIIRNIPKILQCGVNVIGSLIQGLADGLPDGLKKIPDMIKKIADGFGDLVDKAMDIGKNFLEGIWNGISDKVSWLYEKIKGFCNGVVSKVKEFFGIHSPSRVMKEQVGTYLADGVGEGFVEEMKSVTNDMNNAIPTDFATDYDVTRNIATNYSNTGFGGLIDYDRLAGAMKKLNMIVVLDDTEVGRVVDNRIVEAMAY